MRFLILAHFLFMAAITFSYGAVAQDNKLLMPKEEKPVYGLAVGNKMPAGLSGVDHLGRPIELSTLYGRKGMVVYFVRSLEWSPHCIFQLEEVSRSGAMITNMGYSVVVVSYESPRLLKRFSEKYDFPYFLISDKDSKIIKSFGIFNADYVKGTSYYGVPYPAVYIIQPDGMIAGKFFDSDPKIRPNLKEVSEYLRFLQADADMKTFEPVQ